MTYRDAVALEADLNAGGATRSAAPPRRDRVVAAALVAWTLFVWVGRIRNALADPDPAGATVLLSLSLAVPAAVVGVALVVGWRRGSDWGRATASGLAALGVWTIAVWLVRAADIALGGDWGVGFVAVHLVLAAVSIGLAVPTVLAARSVLRPTVSASPSP